MPLVALVASSSAGAIAAFATTPFDVVKTRRQVEIVSNASVAAKTACRRRSDEASASLWRSLACIARNEGMAALFSGGLPRVARVAPACAIMLGTYELTKSFMQ